MAWTPIGLGPTCCSPYFFKQYDWQNMVFFGSGWTWKKWLTCHFSQGGYSTSTTLKRKLRNLKFLCGIWRVIIIPLEWHLYISPFPSSTAPYCTVELAIHNSPIQNFIIHLVVRSSRIYNQNIGSIKNNTRCNKVFNKLRYKEVASCKLPYVL